MATTQNINNKGRTAKNDDLTKQIEALQDDFHKLSKTLGELTGDQIGRAQDKALDKAAELEAVVRRHPLATVGIALGLGFVFGIMNRR